MLYVVITKSLTTFVPMMTVPNMDTGWKVVEELKAIDPKTIFSLVGDNEEENKYNVENYDHWDWNFLHTQNSTAL